MSDAAQLYFQLGTLQVEFSTAAQLAAALDASLKEAGYYGGPWVTLHREAELPAWLWLGDLVKQRPQDWAVIGRTLQFVCLQGLDGPAGIEPDQQITWRHQALVDVCASDNALPLLLPWTEPLGQLLGDVVGTRSACGWGGQPPHLRKVLADQRQWLAEIQAGGSVTVDLDGARVVSAKAGNPAELRELASKTAGRSKTPRGLWAQGRWGWLAELILLQPWSQAEELQLVRDALMGPDLAHTAAALEWLGAQVDPLRHLDLLDQLAAKLPSWATTPATKKPPGWSTPLRVQGAADARTWGDMLQRLRTLGQRQRAVRLIDDLPIFAVA